MQTLRFCTFHSENSIVPVVIINPIVVGLFDSTILVGGGQKSPPYLTLDW